MKFLISTKAFKKLLDQIPEGEFVQRVNMDSEHGGVLTLITNTKKFEIPIHILVFRASENVTDRRWDWVHHLMQQVNEQPIVVEIYKETINLIFQY